MLRPVDDGLVQAGDHAGPDELLDDARGADQVREAVKRRRLAVLDRRPFQLDIA